VSRAGLEDVLGFVGPTKVAEEASTSVGALYHHWPDGRVGYLSDLATATREASTAGAVKAFEAALDPDRISALLVEAVAVNPALCLVALSTPHSAEVVTALNALLDRSRRRLREPWTTTTLADAVVGVAVGAAVVSERSGEAQTVVADVLRALLAVAVAPLEDDRDFDTTIADFGGRRTELARRQSRASVAVGLAPAAHKP